MLKMRLPVKAAAEEEQKRDGSGEESGERCLDKETVFEWFGLRLSPAKRVEFMCGLLHMCQPLELRFLGACLEDLARKDFHVLRDFESRANSPAELDRLTDVGDPVVLLSRLLVYLSLLGSRNRECAEMLYRTLSRNDVLHCGFPCPHLHNRHQNQPVREAGKPEATPTPESLSLEQLSLLLTMASFHPAFTFHQRELVRTQLESLEARFGEGTNHCRSVHNQFSHPDYIRPHGKQGRTWPSCPGPIPHLCNMPQRQVVHIEKIMLKEVLSGGDGKQYSFEVKWSDSSSNTVTKSHQELQDFLLKLSEEQSTSGLGPGLMAVLDQAEDKHRDVERMLREMFLEVPQDFLHMCQVSRFFLPDVCPHCSCPAHLLIAAGNVAPEARNRQSAARLSEDCSETSSLEEDANAFSVSYSRSGVSHGGGRSTTQGKQHSEGQWECSRRSLNREVIGRRRSSQPYGTEEEQEGERSALCVSAQSCSEERNAIKNKGRPTSKRDRSRRGVMGKSSITNGIQRPPAAQMINQAMCKAGGKDAYGDSSSESSNSAPSSPVHQQRSLHSQDTESQSDNSAQELASKPPLSKLSGRKAVALVNPLVAEQKQAHREVYAHPSPTVELALTSCLPYTTPANQERHSADPPDPTTMPQLPLGPVTMLSHTQCPLKPAFSDPLQAPSTAIAHRTRAKPCTKAIAQPLTTSTNLAHPPFSSSTLVQPQPEPSLYVSNATQTGCTNCGCRGSCGASSTHHSPNFFLPPQPTRQLFGPPPAFFQLPPSLCGAAAATFPTQTPHSNGTAALPFYAPTAFAGAALLHAHSEHLLTAQTSYALQPPQVPPFNRFYPPVFPSVGLVRGGAGAKKVGGASCYNCGTSGHYAQDCKQPSMDAGQTGGFRLKYVATNSSEAQHKAD